MKNGILNKREIKRLVSIADMVNKAIDQREALGIDPYDDAATSALCTIACGITDYLYEVKEEE